MTNDSTEPKTDASTDFLKSWAESFSRILQSACHFTPEAMPPEMLRQIRAGVFQALAKSWEEFMRTPQFLEGMKQMMDNAVTFRQITGDFFTRIRRETQGVSREDMDSILLAVREMEARLTRRMDELTGRIGPERGRPRATRAGPLSPGQKRGRSRDQAARRKQPARKFAVKRK